MSEPVDRTAPLLADSGPLRVDLSSAACSQGGSFEGLSRRITEVAEVTKEGSSRTRRCAFWTLGLVVAGVVVVYAHSKAGGFLKSALDWAARFGPMAAVYISLLTAMVTVAAMPTFPLMVGSGVLFCHMYGLLWGTVLGVATVLSGIWLGSVCAFAIGRYLCAEWAQRELQKHSWMREVEVMIDAEGLKVVLLLRMSPMLPLEVFNYACAAMPLPFWKFVVGSLGSVVPILFWVFTSAQGAQLASAATDGDKPGSEDEDASPHRRIVTFTFMAAMFIFDVVALYLIYKKHPAASARSSSQDNPRPRWLPRSRTSTASPEAEGPPYAVCGRAAAAPALQAPA